MGKFYLSIAMKMVQNKSYSIHCQLPKINCTSTNFCDAANLAPVLTLHTKLELDFHSVFIFGFSNCVFLICVSGLHLDVCRFVQ